jgi:regulatory protein
MPTGTITAIAIQAQDTQRVNIFVDGQFAIGIGLATLAAEQLFVGMPLDEAAWARLEAAGQAEKAMLAAMRLIDTRPRSADELRQRLRRKAFPPEVAEAAVARLSELGLVDDAAFTRTLIESRQSFRPRGTLAIRDELRRKGVSRDVIDAAIAETDDPEAETERAMAVARTALRRYANAPDKLTFQRRLGGLLQRRGFSLNIVRPILGTLWAELHGPNDDENEQHTLPQA